MRRFVKTKTLSLLVLLTVLAFTIIAISHVGSTSETKIIAWGQYVSHEKNQPPGNSIEAVLYSSKLGFDGIELDVQMSKDGHVVLMHDSTIDQTTDGTGFVQDYTLPELRKLSLGNWGGGVVRIATLREALEANKGRLALVDWRPKREYESALASAVAGHNVIVLAYSREDAMRLKRALPSSQIFLKSYLPIDNVEISQARGLDGLILDGSSGVPDEFLARVHGEGLELITFVHNSDLGRWHLWKQIWQGVDYVLTTRPDWAEEYPL